MSHLVGPRRALLTRPAVAAPAGGVTNPVAGYVARYRAGAEGYADGAAVTNFHDQSGNSRDLATGTAPVFRLGSGPNGKSYVDFNGSTHYLKTASFTLAQPIEILLVFRCPTWTATDHLLDGVAANDAGILYQTGTTPGLGMYAGGSVINTSALALNTWGYATLLFNGASSQLWIGTASQGTANVGSGAMGGLVLGARSDGTLQANVHVAEAIVYAADQGATNRSTNWSYVQTEYAL